jgi:SAM-dependent MidA family methyltransferase
VLSGADFAGDVHLVETSPVLRDAQKRAVPDAIWHDSIGDLPGRPLLLVANEFLDALPVRQHVGGIERSIVVAGGHLAFDRDGEVVESSPAREDAAAAIASNLAKFGGAALLIDYGHAKSALGDTLQAVHAHGYAEVLERPGEQDLTAHVDFECVRRVAHDAGAVVSRLVTQGDWLRSVGIDARAQTLASKNPQRTADVEAAHERLVATDQMGEMFKMIAIHAPNWPAPAGFA